MNNEKNNIDLPENKCPECNAYKLHSPNCSLMDLDCAKELLSQYYSAWLKLEMNNRDYCNSLYNKIEKAKKEAEFWKGKFVVVKNENNKLRKK
jgi:hypothetical protein